MEINEMNQLEEENKRLLELLNIQAKTNCELREENANLRKVITALEDSNKVSDTDIVQFARLLPVKSYELFRSLVYTQTDVKSINLKVFLNALSDAL